jgi:hypothetical protein
VVDRARLSAIISLKRLRGVKRAVRSCPSLPYASWCLDGGGRWPSPRFCLSAVFS